MRVPARVQHMSYASNLGMARLYCQKCRDDTIHRHQKCIHCETPYQAAQPQPVNLTAREVMALEAEVRQRKKGRSAPRRIREEVNL
jgi:hypothetical protein